MLVSRDSIELMGIPTVFTLPRKQTVCGETPEHAARRLVGEIYRRQFTCGPLPFVTASSMATRSLSPWEVRPNKNATPAQLTR